jgi:fructokinase
MGLIYTCSDRGAWLYAGGTKMHEPARKIQVVSTIGAGDSFNAGIITGLVETGLLPVELLRINEPQWSQILGKGIEYASEVCQGYDNYISWRNR